MSAAIERQSANQVNQLFPDSLNRQSSSENPVLGYKNRKNKLAHNSQSSCWTSDAAVELFWLISLHLCHSKLPTQMSKQCWRADLSHTSPSAAFTPAPAFAPCLSGAEDSQPDIFCRVGAGGQQFPRTSLGSAGSPSSPCSYLALLFNKPSEPRNKTSLETKT